MSYRQNLITGDPIIFAPERAGRPNAFRDTAEDDGCPFCPGNEGETPPEIARLSPPAAGGSWTARVVPNKYPATPHHEVIIESPAHEATFAEVRDPAAIVNLYKQRYQEVISREDVKHVCVFKNHGPRAGASIAHLHSQLIGTPFQPPRVEREAAAFAGSHECPLCAAIPRHRRERLMVAENDHFAWFAPYGSSMTYQQWIVPRKHQPGIASLSDSEVGALADLLAQASATTLRLSSSMNWIFMNFAGEPAAHFYVDLFPRMTTVAGYELGTGTWIDIVDPAEVARKVSR